jgi:hypothetical protein
VSGQLHAPATLSVGETAAGTHWTGGWVGPKASLEATEQRQTLPLLGVKPQSSSPRPVTVLTEVFQLVCTCVHIPTYKHTRFPQLTFKEQQKATKIFLGNQPCQC